MESVESSRERRPRECLEHILEVERRWTPKPKKVSCGIKDQARSVTPCEKYGLDSTDPLEDEATRGLSYENIFHFTKTGMVGIIQLQYPYGIT